MNGEINILGVYVPALLVWVGLAFGLKELVCRQLLHLGVYRWVWHRPVFDSALFVLLLGGIVRLTFWMKL
jgi:hypothetical protein